jgi:hypothetical protein
MFLARDAKDSYIVARVPVKSPCVGIVAVSGAQAIARSVEPYLRAPRASVRGAVVTSVAESAFASPKAWDGQEGFILHPRAALVHLPLAPLVLRFAARPAHNGPS